MPRINDHGDGQRGKAGCYCTVCGPMKKADQEARNERRLAKSDGWKLQASALLEGGASYREVSRTVGIDHGHISRVFPGYGWTNQEGGQFSKFVQAYGVTLDS